SMTPVIVGSAVAFAQRQFHPGLFAVAFVASVAIHAGANLANDYYDHVRGADTPESIGPSGVIQHGLLRPRTVLRGASTCSTGARTLATVIAPAPAQVHLAVVRMPASPRIAAGILARVTRPLSALVILTVPDGARVWRVVKVETDPRVLTSKGIRATAHLHQR